MPTLAASGGSDPLSEGEVADGQLADASRTRAAAREARAAPPVSAHGLLVTRGAPRSGDPGSDPPGATPTESAGAGARARLGAYLALTKPRIIELLLVTTVPAMVLAARGVPDLWLVVATLGGGALAAGSANTLNCVLDRDIDGRMARTSARPLVVSQVSPRAATAFGLALGAAAAAVLALAVNLPSAGLAVAAIAFYVGVYTVGLKRRTPSNIVIGGAAGCFPVLIGWSAVTGGVGWPAVVLFAIIFLWTPPHFWALALQYRDDYAAAGVPMFPVVAPAPVVTRRMLVYTYLMIAASLVLVAVAHTGWPYAVVAGLAGLGFAVEAHLLDRRARVHAPLRPMRLFHASITYLTLLFCAVAASQFVR